MYRFAPGQEGFKSQSLTIAFIVVSSLPLALPETQELRREDGVPQERSAWPGWQRHSTPGEPGVVRLSRQPCAMAAFPLVGRSPVRWRRPPPGGQEGLRTGSLRKTAP